jgi:hypothetical protein
MKGYESLSEISMRLGHRQPSELPFVPGLLESFICCRVVTVRLGARGRRKASARTARCIQGLVGSWPGCPDALEVSLASASLNRRKTLLTAVASVSSVIPTGAV